MTDSSSSNPSDPRKKETVQPDGQQEPSEIPGYELLGKISSGGQATVYRARSVASQQIVAVKILHLGILADDSARKRFAREVAALKVIEHPNIVRVIDSGETSSGLNYLVMNLIDGDSLDHFWQDRNIPGVDEDESAGLLRLFQSICETMAVVHRKGITHRDLSPSNILIDAHGRPQIIDFGLASTPFDIYITPGGGPLSIPGQFFGNCAYASPEQARGDHAAIDIRTDVYALGVILYQIITGGQFPYEVGANVADALRIIIWSPPKSPSAVVASMKAANDLSINYRRRRVDPLHVNPAMEAIVLKSLAKNPEDRYVSAAELGKEIEQYLRGRAIVAAMPAKPAVSVTTAIPVVPPTIPTVSRSNAGANNRDIIRAMLAGAALAILLLCFVAVALHLLTA